MRQTTVTHPAGAMAGILRPKKTAAKYCLFSDVTTGTLVVTTARFNLFFSFVESFLFELIAVHTFSLVLIIQ